VIHRSENSVAIDDEALLCSRAYVEIDRLGVLLVARSGYGGQGSVRVTRAEALAWAKQVVELLEGKR
jgi:hypothetical protein